MPAHVKDDLFRLVRSLDRAEVGYVKKYWSRYSNDPQQDYAVLFDIIRDLPEATSAALKEAVRGFPWAHRLSSVKNYCMQRLLEALRAYNTSGTPIRELNQWLDDADLLLDHGLPEEAAKRAAKALASAEAHEAFIPWLRALAWLKRYQQLIRNAYEHTGGQIDLSAEQRRVLHLYQNSLDYEELGNTMHRHLVRHSSGDRDSTRWLDAAIDHPLLSAPHMALSHSARANYYLIRCNWQRMHRNDAGAAFAEASALNDLRVSEPDFFGARHELNETSWYTYLFCALEALKPDIYLQDADPFYSWKEAVRIERSITRATRSWMLESNYALYERSYERLMEIEPNLRYFYRNQGENIAPHNRVVLVFSMVRACMERGLERHRAFWSAELTQLDDAVRPDLHASAMLFELMLAADRQDMDFLRSRTRSLERYIKKHLPPSILLDRTVSFFRRLPDCPAGKERQLGAATLSAIRAAPPPTMFDPVGNAAIDRWFEERYAPAESKRGAPGSR